MNVETYLTHVCLFSLQRQTTSDNLTKTTADYLCCTFTSLFFPPLFAEIVFKMFLLHTLWSMLSNRSVHTKLNSLDWRHLVSARGRRLRAQVHKIQCHLFPRISSLSPSCHPSAWQHKVIASRCNQDYMLVTHSLHSVAYNVWNRHEIKPVHRWEDKMFPLNIHPFSVCSNASPKCRHWITGKENWRPNVWPKRI